jgi:hypothetical protein
MQTACQLTNAHKNNRLKKFLSAKWGSNAAGTGDEPAETQVTQGFLGWGGDASGEAAMQQ